MTMIALTIAFQVLIIVLASRIKWFRQQVRKFRRLSKQGPFYRGLLWCIAKFWQGVSAVSWATLGDRMDVLPGSASVPKMKCVAKGVDAIGVAWNAKKSSRFSRDAQELQIRGCVGPLDKALATEWLDIDETFTLEGEVCGGQGGEGAPPVWWAGSCAVYVPDAALLCLAPRRAGS